MHTITVFDFQSGSDIYLSPASLFQSGIDFQSMHNIHWSSDEPKENRVHDVADRLSLATTRTLYILDYIKMGEKAKDEF